jgi:hypothetical protein
MAQLTVISGIIMIYIYNLSYRSYVIPFVTVSWAIPSGKHTKNYGKPPLKKIVNQLFP